MKFFIALSSPSRGRSYLQPSSGRSYLLPSGQRRQCSLISDHHFPKHEWTSGQIGVSTQLQSISYRVINTFANRQQKIFIPCYEQPQGEYSYMNIETIFASLHFVVHLALLSFEFAISTYSIFGCDCEHSPRKVEVGFLIQFLKKTSTYPFPWVGVTGYSC
jgi:hypothetical protein